MLTFIPYPVITSDKLLISIFGGVFLGIGIGLGMRGGCAIDGIEVLALYTLRRSGFSIAEIILGINVILFLIAAMGLGMVTALVCDAYLFHCYADYGLYCGRFGGIHRGYNHF